VPVRPGAAQQDTNPAASSPSASHAQVEPRSDKNAAQRNPLLADNGEVRVSKLIGTTGYN
jgi:hypothetical protein